MLLPRGRQASSQLRNPLGPTSRPSSRSRHQDFSTGRRDGQGEQVSKGGEPRSQGAGIRPQGHCFPAGTGDGDHVPAEGQPGFYFPPVVGTEGNRAMVTTYVSIKRKCTSLGAPRTPVDEYLDWLETLDTDSEDWLIA